MLKNETVAVATVLRNIIGAFLVFLHNGPLFYWGNMSVYIISYSYQHTDIAHEQVRPALVVTVYTVCWTISMLASGFLVNIINRKIILATAIILLNCSFVVSYLVIDVSLPAFFVVFGIFVGFGTGLYEGPLLQFYVIPLSQIHTGLLTAIAVAGGPTGGVIMNQFVTWYTNVHNLSPDSDIGVMKVFTQKEILEKVPSMLLIMSASFLTLQTIGCCLLRDLGDFHAKTEESHIVSIGYNSTKNEQQVNHQNDLSSNKCQSDSNDSTNNITKGKDYTPREMIQSINFYKICFAYILGISLSLVINTYYKVYGQEWISDDHFLTILGTAQTISSIPSTIVWGQIMDTKGVKLSFMIMYSGMSLSCLLMYFTAHWDKWLYFITTLILACCTNLYTCFSVAVVRWFGGKFFAANLAILETASSLGLVVAAIIIDPLIEWFGYIAAFAWAATLGVIGLVVITLTFPQHNPNSNSNNIH